MANPQKVILITGVSKGIGNGLATKYIELGHSVIGIERNPGNLSGLNKVYELDLTNNQSIDRVAKSLLKDYSKIDILINNAGIGSDYDDKISKAENFELRFRTHLFGTFYFTEALLPIIKSGGKIVNISSKLSSFEEVDKIEKEKLSLTKMAYIMSKTSLNMYTKLLANRLADQEIEVIGIHPGWVKTKLSTTNKDAPMTINESVSGIINVLNSKKTSGTFWNAKNQKQLHW